MLNFFHAQAWANATSLRQSRASLGLAPESQEDESGGDARSVQSSVQPARVRSFRQSLLQTVGAGKAHSENHTPEGQSGIART